MSCESPSGLISLLSCYTGTSEPALKLLLTVFSGYPLALIYRKYVHGKQVELQHLYFIATGFALGVWNYGFDMFHCMFAIFFTFIVLYFLKGTAVSVGVTFIFNLGYLLVGYYLYGTNDYDINWTMPQCILVLRLVGIAYDLYDGHQPQESLSAENKKVALFKRPTILEIFGHCLFPSAFLVGPQFAMRRYLDFVDGKFSNNGAPPNCVAAAVQRFLLGLLYLTIFQVLGVFITDDYVATDVYGQLPFYKRLILMGVWGRYTLYKYISCWLLTEGACILFGMSYNGKDENGEAKWNGVENIKLGVFENTTLFNHYIQSFNVNTNHWVAQYVYKRLKFLNNRNLSQFLALMFLAVWHGFHSGYYFCFIFEFLVIYIERDIQHIVSKNEILSNFFGSSGMKMPLEIFLRIYTFVFMGWCLMPFALLKFPVYWKAYGNINYIGIIIFVGWPLIYSPLIRLALKKKKRETHTE